ncbi:MAG: hypothetical protein ACUVWP_03275 [bacterium]
MPQVQSKLELNDIRNLMVVRLLSSHEKQFHDDLLEIEQLFETSKSLYSQAENLLLEELGLRDFKPEYKLSYTATLSNVFSSHRIDAEYFQPAYEEVIRRIKERNYIQLVKIKDIAYFVERGKQPNYVENGEIPIIIQKHLGEKFLSLPSEIRKSGDTPCTDKNFWKLTLIIE